MKNFSFRIFILVSIIMGIGLFLSYLVAFTVSDNYRDISLFWKIISWGFFVFSFPILELYRIFSPRDTDIFLWGWALNCLLNGFLIERLFYLRKKKSKIPPVPTRI
jgi:hypothetical protein